MITNDDDSVIRVAVLDAGLVQHVDIALRQQLRDGSLVRALQSRRR